MAKIRYSKRIEAEALKRGQKMVDNGLYDRMGFSYEDRVNKAKIGCIGEMVFESVLCRRGINFETDNGSYENRNSDNFDFRINGKLIDVKVAKSDKTPNDSWTYGYPVEQTNHYKDYVAVGVVNELERSVTFYGWIEFEKIKSYETTDKNKFAGFEYSTPNHEFKYGDMNKDFNALWEACNCIN